jgi:hypothetical protein
MCYFYPDLMESAITDRTRAKTSGVNSGSDSTTSRSARAALISASVPDHNG